MVGWMAAIDRHALTLSNDVRTQLQPMYKKIDESAQLTDDASRR